MRAQAVVAQYEASSAQDRTALLKDHPAAAPPPSVQPPPHEAGMLSTVRTLIDELSTMVDRGEYEGQPLPAAVIMARLRVAVRDLA